MLYSGLVSVSFRKLSPPEIIKLVKKAGLTGIEWGGDIHVPHGDTRIAAETVKMTEEEGLKVASYGSYYRVGGHPKNAPFESVLETAVALHAPTIRVWAGSIASKDADDAHWNTIVNETRHIAGLAAEAGITVSFEYHPNTLTDTPDAACRLMKEIAHKHAKSYWQSEATEDTEIWMAGLRGILPWLTNIHVSCSAAELADIRDIWSGYIDVLKKEKDDRFCMIEFVKGGSPEQFLKDAEVLKDLLK